MNEHAHAQHPHLVEAEPEDGAGSSEITIQGHVFVVPAPYSEGHVINGPEAATLNQTFRENLRNNFASRLRRVSEEHGKDVPEHIMLELKASFQKYADEYEFQGKRVGVTRDPVASEATKIAKDKIREALAKRGTSVKNLKEGKFDELVAGLLHTDPKYATQREAIWAEAKRRIESANAVALEAID